MRIPSRAGTKKPIDLLEKASLEGAASYFPAESLGKAWVRAGRRPEAERLLAELQARRGGGPLCARRDHRDRRSRVGPSRRRLRVAGDRCDRTRSQPAVEPANRTRFRSASERSPVRGRPAQNEPDGLRYDRHMRPLALLCLTTALLGIPTAEASDQLRQDVQRIFGGDALNGKSFGPARWIRNGASFTTVEAGEIIEYETATGKRSPLITAAQLTPPGAKKALDIEDYWWDREMRRLLVFTETKKYWRTNSLGDYWVLTRESGSLKKLGGAATPASSLMYATFSPDGTQVAYVRAGNLYVEDLNTGDIRALTKDGSETLINGAGDWVYEEELNLRQAFRWSPDGRHVAFWQFDEAGVERFTMINNTDSLYPNHHHLSLPEGRHEEPRRPYRSRAVSGRNAEMVFAPRRSS